MINEAQNKKFLMRNFLLKVFKTRMMSISPVLIVTLCLINLPASASTTYEPLIKQAAQEYQVPERLIRLVIKYESANNQKALSKKGAMGLMQLMPDTAKRFGVQDAYDPAQNISAGTRYLKWLMKRYRNNIPWVLAAYNAGEGKVDKYKGIPPYKETRNYVASIMGEYNPLYVMPDGLAKRQARQIRLPVRPVKRTQKVRGKRRNNASQVADAYSSGLFFRYSEF